MRVYPSTKGSQAPIEEIPKKYFEDKTKNELSHEKYNKAFVLIRECINGIDKIIQIIKDRTEPHPIPSAEIAAMNVQIKKIRSILNGIDKVRGQVFNSSFKAEQLPRQDSLKVGALNSLYGVAKRNVSGLVTVRGVNLSPLHCGGSSDISFIFRNGKSSACVYSILIF